MATTYTEPTPQTGYVDAILTAHRGIFDYIVGWGDPAASTRIGPNFAFFIPEAGTVVDLDCDIIPADAANILREATAYDKGSRRCMKPTEWNAFQRFKNAREAVLAKIADDLLINGLQRLDTILNASTNTLALATDNTVTLTEFWRGYATLSQYGVSAGDMIFVTSSPLVVATMIANGATQVTPNQSSVRGASIYFGGVPVVIDPNMTNSASTGGTAAYMWAKGGVVGGFDDLDVTVYGTKDRLTQSYDITASWAYAFALTESDTLDRRVLRFINP
jgi:hypothetical protein